MGQSVLKAVMCFAWSFQQGLKVAIRSSRSFYRGDGNCRGIHRLNIGFDRLLGRWNLCDPPRSVAQERAAELIAGLLVSGGHMDRRVGVGVLWFDPCVHASPWQDLG